MGVIAQIGYGYWGPNLARNLQSEAGSDRRYLIEKSPERRAVAAAMYPHVRVVDELDAVLSDPDVSSVIVATPAVTHADLARRALLADKHVLVEKPLALTTAEAVDLASTADGRGLVLMVGCDRQSALSAFPATQPGPNSK
jgi:predicted dehydrogenase